MVLPFLIFVTFVLIISFTLQKHGTRASTMLKRRLPPGPVGLPLVGYLPFLGKTPAETMVKLSKRYGNIISCYFGQTHVVILNDLDTIKELGRMDVFMGRFQLEIMKPFRDANCGIIFLEGKGWHEWRRFTFKSLKEMGYGKTSMEDLILDQVQNFCDYLRAKVTTPIYVKDEVEVPVVNSLWQILAGEQFDMDDPEKKDVFRIINEGVSNQNILGMVCFLPWFCKLFPTLTGYDKAAAVNGPPFKVCRDAVSRHLKVHAVGYERDFIDVALTKIKLTRDPASFFYKEVGMKNLFFTLFDIFFTGSDSVSTIIGWAMFYLAAFPRVQVKVQEEIDEVVGRGRLPGLEHRLRMIYVEATMMEVLRKSSGAPLGAMHTALEDTEFRGFFIPKRTVIMGNLHSVHHNPDHWGDPMTFRPERFLNSDGSLRRDDHFIPFFTGKRSCPGEALAFNQIFLFLTGILQNFTVELADSKLEVFMGARPGFIIRPPVEHDLVFVERSFKYSEVC
ncbi:unnamed protein product [Allacma fusca]|uniref:Cytochrome P450 n=1 Tax=Allacma fusca TaxID=39272 RepID=A0A8J2J3K6_9HEXA|nr:unnamed protein product [Allacma fusca]